MDVALETAKEYPLTLKEQQQQQQQLLTMKEPPPHPPSKASSILVVEDDAAANNGTNGTNNNTNNNNNNNNNNGTNNPVPHNEVELLRRELEKERQSKMALENMIIVSSLNMIGKIEVLEKKHESQLEHLREQLQIYAEKEQETSVLTRNLEDMNMKLRRQVQELEKKLRDGGSGGKEGKEGKESKRKRQVNVVDVEKEGKDYSKDKDLSPHPWGEPSSSAGGGGSSGGNGKLKRSKTDATEKKSKGGKASAASSSYVDSDPLREMVAEALGTIGDIEKGERPPQRPHPRSSSSLQGSTEGTASLHLAHSSVDGTPPSQIKRRKTDPGLNNSQDGTPSSPPLSYSHSSPAISESYTSNYSTFFQYGSSASSAYPASPSSAPQSPASLASSASSVPTHLSNSQNGTSHAHLSSSQSGSYSLSSSRDGNRSSDEYEPVSPSAKRSLVPLFPPASILLPNSPHEKLLSDVHQFQIAQKDRLEKMQQTQKQLIVERKHDPLLVGALESEQMQLRQQIDAEVKAIKQLDKQIVLEPNQLFRLDFLLQDLKIQQKQLELFHNELQAFITAPDPSRCHAALVITKQPFPMVISKFKQLQEEQLVVQLLSGSNVDFHSFSVVKAELICHTKAITKGSTSASNPNASLKKHVDRDTQPLDLSKGVAKFPLKFLTGTRKSCVTLRFVVQVKTASNTVTTVESNASQPFIVITNDCQWEGSEGTLLKNEAFSDQIEIPWAQFVNILQRHFLKATRQSPIQPTRPLSLYDFNYLNTKFFANKPIVSHKSFDNFWGWFGKSLQTVRYKRHISTLWQNGLIFMFLTRERVTQILRNQEPGCFIILFSEAYPGQLEISYVASDKLSASQQNLGLSSSSQGLGTQHMLSLNGSSQGLSLSTSNQSLPTSPTSISTPPPPHHTSSSSSSSSFDPSSPEPPQRHHTPIEPPQPAAHVNPLAASYDGINNSRHLDSNNNNNNNATETKPGPFLSNNNNNNNNITSPEQNNTNVSTSPSDSNANNNNNNNLSTSGANVNTAATTPTTPTSSSSSGLTIVPPSTPTLTVASAPITPTSAPITPTPSTPSSGNALSVSASSTPLASQLTVHGNKIKHYLVQANDTAGSKRTLPDFLNECPQFTHILQLNVATLNTSTDWATVGVPSFKKQPKDQVLEPFYSKRGATSPGFIANGYDPL